MQVDGGLNKDYAILSQPTKPVNVDAVIYRGRPVALNSSGEIIAGGATSTMYLYGLADFDKNTYRDSTNSPTTEYGSGQGNVVIDGIVTVGPIVDYRYGTTGATTVVQVYDNTKTYAITEKLYVDTNGLITNDATQKLTDTDGAVVNYIGRVLKAPSGTDSSLEIMLGIKDNH